MATTEPWSADREFTHDDALAAIRAEFPTVGADVLEYMGSGWDFDAYVADQSLVFRFPRRREVAERLGREKRILEYIRPELAELAQIPEIVLEGGPTAHFPYRFFAHRLIPGVAADRSRAGATGRLARELGLLLGRLHSIEAMRYGDFFPLEDERCIDRYEELMRILGPGHRAEDLAPAAYGWVRDEPSIPSEPEGLGRLVHNDFCPDHILVDNETGALLGVIDWSDAALGDPALDFVLLALWGQWPFVRQVQAVYPLDVDQGFAARLEFLARVLSLKWLVDAIERGGEVEKHRGWVFNAFGSSSS